MLGGNNPKRPLGASGFGLFAAKQTQKQLATLATPETLNALSDDKSARRVIEGVKAAYM